MNVTAHYLSFSAICLIVIFSQSCADRKSSARIEIFPAAKELDVASSLIKGARKSILVKSKSILSDQIADSLADAKLRGVKISILSCDDDTPEIFSRDLIPYLGKRGIDTRFSLTGRMNNCLLIDDSILLDDVYLGIQRWNWGYSKMDILVIHDKITVDQYKKTWSEIFNGGKSNSYSIYQYKPESGEWVIAKERYNYLDTIVGLRQLQEDGRLCFADPEIRFTDLPEKYSP